VEESLLSVKVYGVNYVRHTETHMAEPLVPKTSASEVEMANENLKRYTSSGTEYIPAELIRLGGIIPKF
jgi:hypothetical protein